MVNRRKQLLLPKPEATEQETLVMKLRSALQKKTPEEQHAYILPKNVPLYSLRKEDFPGQLLTTFRRRICKARNSEMYRNRTKKDVEIERRDQIIRELREQLEQKNLSILGLEADLSEKITQINDLKNRLDAKENRTHSPKVVQAVDSPSYWENNYGDVRLGEQESCERDQHSRHSSGNRNCNSHHVNTEPQPSSKFLNSDGKDEGSFNRKSQTSTEVYVDTARINQKDELLPLSSQNSSMGNGIITNEFRDFAPPPSPSPNIPMEMVEESEVVEAQVVDLEETNMDVELISDIFGDDDLFKALEVESEGLPDVSECLHGSNGRQ